MWKTCGFLHFLLSFFVLPPFSPLAVPLYSYRGRRTTLSSENPFVPGLPYFGKIANKKIGVLCEHSAPVFAYTESYKKLRLENFVFLHLIQFLFAPAVFAPQNFRISVKRERRAGACSRRFMHQFKRTLSYGVDFCFRRERAPALP